MRSAVIGECDHSPAFRAAAIDLASVDASGVARTVFKIETETF
jgi:hypothetical protein